MVPNEAVSSDASTVSMVVITVSGLTAQSDCGVVTNQAKVKFAPILKPTKETDEATPLPMVAADDPNDLEFVGAFLTDCNMDDAAT